MKVLFLLFCDECVVIPLRTVALRKNLAVLHGQILGFNTGQERLGDGCSSSC